jgi:ubiquinone/menaquinone biosynthesis C-methylase UbiE
MNTVTNIFLALRKYVFRFFGIVITFIYNAIFSKFISSSAYEGMVRIMDKELPRIKSVLDVGVGTGLSLYKVVDRFEKDTEILGVDFNELYVEQTKKLFKNHANVEIR